MPTHDQKKAESTHCRDYSCSEIRDRRFPTSAARSPISLGGLRLPSSMCCFQRLKSSAPFPPRIEAGHHPVSGMEELWFSMRYSIICLIWRRNLSAPQRLGKNGKQQADSRKNSFRSTELRLMRRTLEPFRRRTNGKKCEQRADSGAILFRRAELCHMTRNILRSKTADSNPETR